MKFRNVVGPQIRKMRNDRGWSQVILAAKLQVIGWDISRSGIAKIESQLVWVGDYELFFLLKIFNVGFETLFPPIDLEQPIDGAVKELTRN